MAGELNLAPRRGASIWDKKTSAIAWRQIDAGYWLSMAGAAPLAHAGGSLVYRATAGRFGAVDRHDIVADASADSFPASDAPPWMA